jgi:hypothetical protein
VRKLSMALVCTSCPALAGASSCSLHVKVLLHV